MNKFYSIMVVAPLVVVAGLLVNGCDVPQNGNNKNEAKDAGPTTDASPSYCEVATGDVINRCSDCLPTGLTTVEKAALAMIFPTADLVELTGSHYTGSSGERTLGHTFRSVSQAYEGPLTTFAGIDTDGVAIRVEFTYAQRFEWIERIPQSFYDQFSCIDIADIDVTNKDWGPYQIDAVSGATITSRAIIENVWNAFEQYEQQIQ